MTRMKQKEYLIKTQQTQWTVYDTLRLFTELLNQLTDRNHTTTYNKLCLCPGPQSTAASVALKKH